MSRSTIAAAMLAMACLTPAWASETDVGDLRIAQPWARATAASAPAGAAYMTVTNAGDRDDRLVAAESDAAETIELHETSMENGTMRMRRVDDGIPLPAGQTVSLAPGGLHIMLVGLAHPLREGESFTLQMSFEEAGSVTLDVPILAPRASPTGTPGTDGASMSGHSDTHSGHSGHESDGDGSHHEDSRDAGN